MSRRLRRLAAYLRDGFLTDPTHISLGLLGLVVAASFVAAAGRPEEIAPLPPFLMLAWAVTFAVSGLGKVVGPFLLMSAKPGHEDTARGVLLGSSILAATSWLTVGVGLTFLGPGATLAVLQCVALGAGAAGRSWAIVRNMRSIDRAVGRAEK